MKIRFDIQLKQSQKLVMTPQLQQAIQILQFTSSELERYVSDELEKNPVLEELTENEAQSKKKSKKDEIREINWKEYVEDFGNYQHNRNIHHKEDNDYNYENIVSGQTTLREHLLFQWNLTILEDKYIEIGEYMINSIDDRGYFVATVEEVAKHFKEKESTIESILQIIQTFDPPGVGARSLEECLIIQLKLLKIEDKNIYTLVEKHLHDIASNRCPHIAKKLGITIGKVQNYCDLIKTLNPKPGGSFAQVENRYILPDVTVKKVGDKYIVLNNDSASPRLIIREDYRKMMASSDENSDVNNYLKEQFNSATWLIRNIQQRKETIYKVCEVIIEKQRDFFEKGRKHLKPLTLREVAEEIEMHESTVSRATNGKYMDTPFGIFELKYFFSSGVGKDCGDEISAESIKVLIKDIIDKENKKKPLSDDRIASLLKDKNINISRRTVAKYRDELGILSSIKRKRY